MLAFIAMNFSLRTAFAASQKFWFVVFSFPFVSRNFYFPLRLLFFSDVYGSVSLPLPGQDLEGPLQASLTFFQTNFLVGRYLELPLALAMN